MLRFILDSDKIVWNVLGASGITALSSNLTFTGNTTFLENIGQHSGAICASSNTILNFNGTSYFVNNSAYNHGGGAIVTSENTVLNFNGTSHFVNNFAYKGGGAICIYNTMLKFNGTSNFVNNSAYKGGGAIIASFMLYLASVEPTDSLATWQNSAVVQFSHYLTLYSVSMAGTTSAATQ